MAKINGWILFVFLISQNTFGQGNNWMNQQQGVNCYVSYDTILHGLTDRQSRVNFMITPAFFNAGMATGLNKNPTTGEIERKIWFSLTYNATSVVFPIDSTLSHSIDLPLNLTSDVLRTPYQFSLSALNSGLLAIQSPIVQLDSLYTTNLVFNFPINLVIALPSPVITVCKPVIYTYPTKNLNLQILLKPKGDFTFTYPQYTDSGWNGIAHPDGSFTINDKTYPYLFWEGVDHQVDQLADYSTGFVVKQAEVTTFLEDKLSEMGLNDKEKTDFITFWGPRMIQAEQGFVQFIFNKDYDQLASLSISPAPEELFRVYMLWTPLENTIELNPQPQEIESVNRSGFYVIEWGGSELIYHPILSSYE